MYYQSISGLEELIMNQDTCAESCSNALIYARGKGPSYEAIAKVIEDCVAICKLRQDLEKRGSELLNQVKALCAEACARCVASCKYANDEQLKQCIETCQTCCNSCC